MVSPSKRVRDSSTNLSNDIDIESSGDVDIVRGYYRVVAGVCLEFCSGIDRLDVLFGQIFNRFVAANQATTLLDLLEPYVLCKKIKYLGPEIMAAFIENFQHKGDLVAIERCLLYLDVTFLDFNNTVGMLRKNSLYSALIHVYSTGLDGP